ncbi:MAG: hypothetical protein N4A53_04420 [Pelagimonas sp.]|jgi:hypothetical protein|nr:hypothetical protein [Pelagimonas sp.]
MRYGTSQLTQKQVRKRIENLLSLAASFDTIARYGAIEIINMVEEYLPLTQDIPLDEEQLEALDIFWRRVAQACDVTAYDIQMVEVLDLSPQWRAVRDWAATSLPLFRSPDALSA